jgi:hypothetical protein
MGGKKKKLLRSQVLIFLDIIEIIYRLMSTFFSGDRTPEGGYAERPMSRMRL